MIKINCDIGERGPENEIDIGLMDYIQIANIACGGHAGDENSINVFRELALKKNVEVSGHLSYPDRENFGRISMDIALEDLFKSLDKQYALIPDIKMIKFHGALYNDVVQDQRLAESLAVWLSKNNIARIITPYDSELAVRCADLNIEVLAEAFAERRYAFDPEKKTLRLVARTKDYASIHDCDQAVEHTLTIINDKQVQAVIEQDNDTLSYKMVPIDADTICIHSDSAISLELAKKLASLND